MYINPQKSNTQVVRKNSPPMTKTKVFVYVYSYLLLFMVLQRFYTSSSLSDRNLLSRMSGIVRKVNPQNQQALHISEEIQTSEICNENSGESRRACEFLPDYTRRHLCKLCCIKVQYISCIATRFLEKFHIRNAQVKYNFFVC